MRLRARNTVQLKAEQSIPPGEEFETDKETADFLIAAGAADIIDIGEESEEDRTQGPTKKELVEILERRKVEIPPKANKATLLELVEKTKDGNP